MLGIQYIKSSPTQYIFHFVNGKLKREGTGLAFFYFKPRSTLISIPVGSADAPFIFNEISADFQPLTVQGQLTYRVEDPRKVASILDFSVESSPIRFLSEDPQKLPQRLVNLLQVLVRADIQRLPLREAIHASEEIATAVFGRLLSSEVLSPLGVEVLDLSIQAIRPIPEMARALEAEAREELLRRADQAIYDRRNSAVEQERRIKENELNTEVAVEGKKRQIRETKVEADLAVEMKEQQVRHARISGEIAIETERKRLVFERVENQRTEADMQAYSVEASLRPLHDLSPEMLQLLAVQSADPRVMVSMAFAEIAKNAGKIGNLHISPDLLESLTSARE
jgi:regulator of protease activity HflC (stomatin/prohibitin superfamily)